MTHSNRSISNQIEGVMQSLNYQVEEIGKDYATFQIVTKDKKIYGYILADLLPEDTLDFCKTQVILQGDYEIRNNIYVFRVDNILIR